MKEFVVLLVLLFGLVSPSATMAQTQVGNDICMQVSTLYDYYGKDKEYLESHWEPEGVTCYPGFGDDGGSSPYDPWMGAGGGGGGGPGAGVWVNLTFDGETVSVNLAKNEVRADYLTCSEDDQILRTRATNALVLKNPELPLQSIATLYVSGGSQQLRRVSLGGTLQFAPITQCK